MRDCLPQTTFNRFKLLFLMTLGPTKIQWRHIKSRTWFKFRFTFSGLRSPRFVILIMVIGRRVNRRPS